MFAYLFLLASGQSPITVLHSDERRCPLVSGTRITPTNGRTNRWVRNPPYWLSAAAGSRLGGTTRSAFVAIVVRCRSLLARIVALALSLVASLVSERGRLAISEKLLDRLLHVLFARLLVLIVHDDLLFFLVIGNCHSLAMPNTRNAKRRAGEYVYVFCLRCRVRDPTPPTGTDTTVVHLTTLFAGVLDFDASCRSAYLSNNDVQWHPQRMVKFCSGIW